MIAIKASQYVILLLAGAAIMASCASSPSPQEVHGKNLKLAQVHNFRSEFSDRNRESRPSAWLIGSSQQKTLTSANATALDDDACATCLCDGGATLQACCPAGTTPRCSCEPATYTCQ
jgi:hypothetical protein